jgi:tripartite-type tricarboxylate transporter receptor subunit TctC
MGLPVELSVTLPRYGCLPVNGCNRYESVNVLFMIRRSRKDAKRGEAMRRTRTAAMGLQLFLGFLLAASGAMTALRAEDYPSRPIRVVVGFGPGAVADVILRVMTNRMSQSLGQQLVVENRPGAGSSLGAEYVSRAPKDGYTLLMCTVAQTINPAMNNLSFDFGKDLAPIALVANAPQMLVAHPSLPANNVRELIALAKSQPDGVQYASSGAGTMSHLSGVLLNSAAGIKLQQIPYPGSAQSMTDVLAGRVPLMFGPAATVWSNVQAGKLKALAVTQPTRAAIAPEVPTMVEAGVEGYSAGIWMGLLAPAGTPPEVVDKLSRAANEALKSKEVLSLLAAQGVDPLGGTPAEFARFIEDELKKWDGVVKAAGIKAR